MSPIARSGTTKTKIFKMSSFNSNNAKKRKIACIKSKKKGPYTEMTKKNANCALFSVRALYCCITIFTGFLVLHNTLTTINKFKQNKAVIYIEN